MTIEDDEEAPTGPVTTTISAPIIPPEVTAPPAVPATAPSPHTMRTPTPKKSKRRDEDSSETKRRSGRLKVKTEKKETA